LRRPLPGRTGAADHHRRRGDRGAAAPGRDRQARLHRLSRHSEEGDAHLRGEPHPGGRRVRRQGRDDRRRRCGSGRGRPLRGLRRARQRRADLRGRRADLRPPAGRRGLHRSADRTGRPGAGRRQRRRRLRADDHARPGRAGARAGRSGAGRRRPGAPGRGRLGRRRPDLADRAHRCARRPAGGDRGDLRAADRGAAGARHGRGRGRGQLLALRAGGLGVHRRPQGGRGAGRTARGRSGDRRLGARLRRRRRPADGRGEGLRFRPDPRRGRAARVRHRLVDHRAAVRRAPGSADPQTTRTGHAPGRGRTAAAARKEEVMTDDPSTGVTARPEPRVAPWDRYARLRQVAALDPYRDRQRIHRITAGYEFPFDYQRSLELALFRTYCSPSISGVLSESGEFARRPQKRYDDTAILMAEMVEHGVTSDRGGEAVRNINRMHGMYEISNEDMLYVLSTFVFDPIDWIDRYGWRRLHPHERQAAFHYYIEVGAKMGITDLPETMADFHAFRLDYESRNFVYAETNFEIGTYTVDLFAAWFPTPLRPMVRRGVYAMLTDQMA